MDQHSVVRYLFGDSTPFPLPFDAVTMVRDLTEACVALLRADRELSELIGRHERLVIEAEADRAWAASVTRDLEALIGHPAEPPPSSAATEQLGALHRQLGCATERMQRAFVQRRDRGLAEIEAQRVAQRRALGELLEPLLLSHCLPQTVWGVSWEVDPGVGLARAEAVSLSECGLEASYRLDGDRLGRWERAVPVCELVSELTVQVLRPGRVSSRVRPRPVRLHRLHVTAVDVSGDRATVTLSPKVSSRAHGYRIDQSGSGELTVAPLDAAGDCGMKTALSGEEAEAVRELIQAIVTAVAGLADHRAALTGVQFGDTAIEEVDSPGDVARAMIDAVAPYVQELVARSPSPQELSLKRDIGEGRREELYLPVAEITDRLAGLPAELRACFDAFGLDRAGDDRERSRRRPPPPPPLRRASLRVVTA